LEQKNKQLIVFLAGEIRNKERISTFLNLMNCDIYAADAGYQYALDFHLEPKLVFGDFDSMDKPLLKDLLIYPCEKDQTDSEIALDLAIENAYKDVWFLAPFGGRVDHTLANLALLKKACIHHINLKLYDGENLVFLLNSGTHCFTKKYRYVSFIPVVPKTVLSLEGFKYSLSKKELPLDATIGISNETITDKPIVTVHNGTALCICIEHQQEEL